MASLKDLKDRISSIKSTQKITKAMQLVAAAKLRRAQEAAEAARPYNVRMNQMFNNLLGQVELQDLPSFMQSKGDQNHLLVVATADRGLCGGFNGQIVSLAKKHIKGLHASGKSVKIITVGKKAQDLLRRDYSDLFLEHISLREVKHVSYKNAEDLFKKIQNYFLTNDFDVCSLFYSKFISVMNQQPTKRQLIPLDVNAQIAGANSDTNDSVNTLYEYEPDAALLLESFIPRYISVQIFSALLENAAGEMGAKMTAMDNATRNAGAMVDKFSVSYNRQRQAQITTELIEIIAGAEAL